MPALARFYSDSPAEAASENPRSFAAFTIYKTKGAMRASIIAPSWKSIAAKGALIGTVPGEVLDREGVLLLEFANANPRAAQSMDRTYNWYVHRRKA